MVGDPRAMGFEVGGAGVRDFFLDCTPSPPPVSRALLAEVPIGPKHVSPALAIMGWNREIFGLCASFLNYMYRWMFVLAKL